MSENLALAVRQRVMHRTSGCEALAYQYGWDADTAEARYDADTAVLEASGVLPDLPPSPDVSGTVEVHVEPVSEPEPVVAVAQGKRSVAAGSDSEGEQ